MIVKKNSIMKKQYEGLETVRLIVECQTLMAESKVKVKVKTSETQPWVDEDDQPLSTTLDSYESN